MNLPWQDIDTVLLDMDGTLLDLHFDNHFWQEHLPVRYAEKNNLDLETAKQRLLSRAQAVEGTLDWYCLDYWDQELGMDLASIKKEVQHLIEVRPFVIEFLLAIRAAGKKSVLVTNAHFRSLDLKILHTQIDQYFDEVISTHQFGKAKEQLSFWSDLHEVVPFLPERTLLIDDSLPILRSAQKHGIAHLLAVLRPDSKGDEKQGSEFRALHCFSDIMPTP